MKVWHDALVANPMRRSVCMIDKESSRSPPSFLLGVVVVGGCQIVIVAMGLLCETFCGGA